MKTQTDVLLARIARFLDNNVYLCSEERSPASIETEKNIDSWMIKYASTSPRRYIKLLDGWVIRDSRNDNMRITVSQTGDASIHLIGDQSASLNRTVNNETDFRTAIDSYFRNWKAPPRSANDFNNFGPGGAYGSYGGRP